MPKGKGKKKGGPKGKGKRKPGKRKGRPRGATVGPSGAMSQPMLPPTSYAMNVKSGPRVRFSAGSRPGCLRMDYSFRIAQVIVSPSTAPAPYTSRISFLVPGGTAVPPVPAFEIPVGPMNSYYFPSYIRQLFLLFNEYKVGGMRLRYQPRTATSTAVAFTWAYAQDVEWPDSHGLTTGGIVTPTEAALTSLTSACTVQAFSTCDLSATIMDKSMKYVANNKINGQINYTGDFTAEDRQTMSGIFLIYSEQTVVVTTTNTYGDVYCDLSLELCDFSTPVTQSIAFREKELDRERLWGHERKSRSPYPT